MVFIAGILGLMSEIVLKWIPCVCVYVEEIKRD